MNAFFTALPHMENILHGAVNFRRGWEIKCAMNELGSVH